MGGKAAGAGAPVRRACSTGYPADQARVRKGLAQAPVETKSFSRTIERCDLSVCRGSCCYDGVPLRPEESKTIPLLAKEHAAYFADIGLSLPDEVVVENDPDGPPAPATATAPRPFSSTVEGYPEQFSDTACVFLTEEGFCGLQMLSVALGKHPWHYKPFGCWLHPIILPGDRDRGRRVVLPDERHGPEGGFVCATMCGQTVAGGRPAHEVLEEELTCLGEQVGRDLLLEIRTALDSPE